MLIESRYIVSSLFISTVILFLGWIAALVGKSEAFEKHVNWWRQQRLLKRAAVVAVLIGVIAYAGTKPDPSGGDDTGGSSTNDVTQVEGDANSTNDVGWIEGDLDGTNDVDQVGGDTNSVGGAMLNAPRPMFGGAPSLGGRGSVVGTPVAGTEGFSLVSVGHDETFEFTPPETAVVATNWLLHGASTQPLRLSFDDWVFPYGGEGYSNFTVFAYGEVMPGEVNTNHFLVPFGASLGIVPVANWHLLSTNSNPNNLTIEQSNNSLFWSGFSPSNTLLLTWQNALLDRAVTNPVSFQAELKPSGGFVFRYDLSRLVSDEPLSNAVIMAQSEDAGFADAPTTNLTSLAFHTHDEQLCDENREDFDEKIGDENPYAYPEGSTNTVLEHVFYSETTNGVFAYPQSTDGNAVLMVSVSGSGSGELLVGSKFVPLVGRSAPVSAPRLFAAPPPSPSTLAVTVPRGSTQKVYMRGDSTLSVSFSSEDFAFGSLPDLSGRHFTGWINFPFVNATVPCIHDYNAKKKLVSLPLGGGAVELTCEWQGTSQIEVENIPPVSAMLTGHFSGRTTTPVTYTLSHPNYLFGQTTYSQTARYCPQPPEEDDDDDPPSGDPSWYDGDDDDDDEEHYCWCCFWGSCYPGCGCGCACDIGEGDDEPDEPVDPEPEDYDEASTNYPHMSGVIKIRDPLEYTAPIHLTVPLEHRNCCPCPDHATNWVSVVYKSNRLKVVDAATEMDFHSSGESLDVKIAGVSPSFAVGDAGVSFAANGDVCLECAYTVLGVGIDGGYQYGVGDVDLKMLNQRKTEFGLPIPVNTNLWEASELKLQTKVRLPFGNIHLGFEDSTAPFAVWIYDNRVGGFLKLASSTDGPLDISFAGWRQLVSGSSDSYSPTTWIYITAEGAGKATLVYRYWGVSGSAIVEDEARQVITAVNPSLMVDYDRDGAIDDDDVEIFKTGRHLRFWTNKDIWKGDDAFPPPGLLPPVLTPNFSDTSVNGRNDLVNLCPIKVDLSAFTAAWGTDDFEYVFYTGGSGSTGFALVDVDWDDVRAMVVDDVRTIDGDDLHGVTLLRNERDGWRETGYVLPTDFLDLAGRGSGVIAVEFGQESTSHPLELAVRLKGSNTELFRFTIRLDVYDVEDLFRWVNLAGVCGDGGSVSDYPNQTSYIDLPDSDKEIVFVHGYNMAPHEAREWAQAMFKRLWWMGMNANFTAVTWRGNETQTWVPSVGYVTPNYYQNVFNAFKTAPHLAQVVNALPGAHKYVIAHSLGNMLVSAAIQDYGMSYDKYFMLNAAVAMEAFDSNGGVTAESHANMTPTAWLPYADRVRSTHWHELFPQGDGRRELTWKGRFADVHDIVNFFSTEEEVVNNGDSQSHNITDRNYVWYNQESLKGMWPFMLHEYEGGWAFNPVYDIPVTRWIGGQPVTENRRLTPEEASALTDAQLRETPFFLDFADSDMHDSPNGEVVSSNYLYKAEMLAYAIPSESYAVGANPLAIATENVDMAGEYQNGRDDYPDDEKKKWGHSYFVQRPLKRVNELFGRIVNEIGGTIND